MAKIIKEEVYHNCQVEIRGVDRPDLYLGSIVECSCGKQFIKTENQRDGMYWAPIPSEKYMELSDTGEPRELWMRAEHN